jgi:hypothetical protein
MLLMNSAGKVSQDPSIRLTLMLFIGQVELVCRHVKISPVKTSACHVKRRASRGIAAVPGGGAPYLE